MLSPTRRGIPLKGVTDPPEWVGSSWAGSMIHGAILSS
jgi:hypothetical protein